jgi:chromosome segregation ATPase
LTKQIKKLEKAKQSITAELGRLKDLLKQKELEIEEFKKINNNLVSLINEKINKINVLKQDIDNLKAELDCLNKKIKEQNDKIAYLSKKLKHTDEERDKMWNISFFLGFALLSSVFAINTIK